MAFTFQINDDVQFEHNQQFLDKAKSETPVLHQKTFTSKCLVTLTQDSTKLGGVWVKPSKDKTLDNSFKKGDSIILDFGDHHVGHFSIDIESVGSPMDAPLTLKLKFAEMPIELSQNSEDYKGWLSSSWMQEELVHIDVLPAKLKLPRRYSFRYVELTVVDTSPKWQARFQNPKVIATSSVDIASFKTPQLQDARLQSIYNAGLKTLEDCMQNVFEDGPKRDRRLWLGDLRLQALADYATFNDTTLIKRCLYLFGAMTTTDGRIPANVFTSPQNTPDDTFLFDYSLFFISVLSNLMAHDENQAVLKDLYPIAKKQVDFALTQVDTKGKLTLKEVNPVFIDWSNDFDKETAGQAIMIYTLKQFIGLVEILGDDTMIYQNKLNKMTEFATTKLYDHDAGLFVSGPKREYNIASQVWMTLAQVFDQSTMKGIMQRTVDQLFPVRGIATPYMYHHVVEALFVSGLTKQAITLMKNYWGKMIDLGADTFWEAFEPDNPDYSPYGSSMLNSYCHAWSCTPVYLIKRYILKEG